MNKNKRDYRLAAYSGVLALLPGHWTLPAYSLTIKGQPFLKVAAVHWVVGPHGIARVTLSDGAAMEYATGEFIVYNGEFYLAEGEFGSEATAALMTGTAVGSSGSAGVWALLSLLSASGGDPPATRNSSLVFKSEASTSVPEHQTSASYTAYAEDPSSELQWVTRNILAFSGTAFADNLGHSYYVGYEGTLDSGDSVWRIENRSESTTTFQFHRSGDIYLKTIDVPVGTTALVETPHTGLGHGVWVPHYPVGHGGWASGREQGTQRFYRYETELVQVNSSSTIEYSIVGGADANLFDLDASTGVLTFKDAPDFENPGSADLDNVYDVQIQADNGGGGIATQNVLITVTDRVDNDPPVFTSGTSFNAAENQIETGYSAAATDPVGDTVSFSIIGGADQGLFSLDSSSGAMTFKQAPDYENPTDDGTNNVYEVEIQADGGNGRKAAQTVSVTVTNVDDFALSLNQQTTELFGNDGTALDNGIFERVSDADGKLVVTFIGDGTDYRLKYLAHDIDNSGHPPGEMSISLNGALVGYVPETTPDMSTAQVQTSLYASSQVIGYNVLEFQNINPGFNWGLGQFLLTDNLTDPPITGGSTDPLDYFQ